MRCPLPQGLRPGAGEVRSEYLSRPSGVQVRTVPPTEVLSLLLPPHIERYQVNQDPKLNGPGYLKGGRPLKLQQTNTRIWGVAAVELLQWVIDSDLTHVLNLLCKIRWPREALWKRVLYFLIYGLCFAASTGKPAYRGLSFSLQLTCLATFVVIVLKISQARLSNSLSSGTQGIVLGIFSTPFAFISAVFISRVIRGAQTGSQLDPQAQHWEIRGLVMEVIEASVLYPAIVLNVLKARSEFDAEQDVVSDLLINTRNSY